jgi:hypothetical protein
LGLTINPNIYQKMAGNDQKPTSKDIFTGSSDASVGQDKDAPERISAASSEPRIPGEPANMERPTPKRHGSNKRKTVEIGVCVRPDVAAEIERMRNQGGKRLSRSSVVAAFVEKAVKGHIDMQYGALLKPVIELELRHGLQAYSNRSANLAVNAFYSAEETRILVIQLLSYLLGDQTDILPGLIAQSQKEAYKNLKSRLLKDLEGEDEQKE